MFFSKCLSKIIIILHLQVYSPPSSECNSRPAASSVSVHPVQISCCVCWYVSGLVCVWTTVCCAASVCLWTSAPDSVPTIWSALEGVRQPPRAAGPWQVAPSDVSNSSPSQQTANNETVRQLADGPCMTLAPSPAPGKLSRVPFQWCKQFWESGGFNDFMQVGLDTFPLEAGTSMHHATPLITSHITLLRPEWNRPRMD